MKFRRALVAFALLTLGMGAVWRTAGPTVAQDVEIPEAAIVEGTCTDPGDVVFPLRDLQVRDGGEVLVSLTTVDLALSDLLGNDHAVVLTSGDGVIACGDATGDAADVYVGLVALDDGEWGGVAWLHERDDRTQVSLFVARGLTGADGVTPEPTEDLEPQPPDDETPTPEARATRTPRANQTATSDSRRTYTSPSYGYTLTYDPTIWIKSREISQPVETGPLDLLDLHNKVSVVTLIGETGPPNFDAVSLCEARVGQYAAETKVSGLAVREQGESDAARASVTIEYTYTADDGQEYDWRTRIDCFIDQDNLVMLSFFFAAPIDVAEEQFSEYADLIEGLTFPGG
jgi:hypothetical protein